MSCKGRVIKTLFDWLLHFLFWASDTVLSGWTLYCHTRPNLESNFYWILASLYLQVGPRSGIISCRRPIHPPTRHLCCKSTKKGVRWLIFGILAFPTNIKWYKRFWPYYFLGGWGGIIPLPNFFRLLKIFNLQFLQIKHLNNFGTQIFQDTIFFETFFRTQHFSGGKNSNTTLLQNFSGQKLFRVRVKKFSSQKIFRVKRFFGSKDFLG